MNASDLPDGLRFEYRFNSAPWTIERHDWCLVGTEGAINIWAEASRTEAIDGRRWFGGIEGHHAQPPEYMAADKPSQSHCWLLEAPCWHDGSSLQFSEEVSPMLPDPAGEPMRGHIIDRVLPILKHRYRTWFASAIETRSDATGTGAAEGESAPREAGDAHA